MRFFWNLIRNDWPKMHIFIMMGDVDYNTVPEKIFFHLYSTENSSHLLRPPIPPEFNDLPWVGY